MSDETFPLPDQGILLTHLVVAEDPERTARFYSEGLGGEIVFGEPGAPQFVKLANSWVMVVEGGGETPDKPDVTLSPPSDQQNFDAFMAIRVADIESVYADWTSRGVEFITPPLDNNGYEIRCYARDPDGRIIEVGQATEIRAVFEQSITSSDHSV